MSTYIVITGAGGLDAAGKTTAFVGSDFLTGHVYQVSAIDAGNLLTLRHYGLCREPTAEEVKKLEAELASKKAEAEAAAKANPQNHKK